MQFKTLALTFFVAAATAQDVQDLVSQIPSCATECLATAASSVGCDASDSSCQCSSFTELSKEALPCVSTSCSSDELQETSKLSTEICSAVGSGAASDAVSSATSAAGSSVASATSEAAESATETGAADRTMAGMGLVGAAAMVALAL